MGLGFLPFPTKSRLKQAFQEFAEAHAEFVSVAKVGLKGKEREEAFRRFDKSFENFLRVLESEDGGNR